LSKISAFNVGPRGPTSSQLHTKGEKIVGQTLGVSRKRKHAGDSQIIGGEQLGTTMKIGIVGHGFVGSAMARFFSRHSKHQMTIYDKYQPPFDRIEQKCLLNRSDLVFLCVPTPSAPDGLSCDTSCVEDCLEWIEPPVCIRSTVIPGTVDHLVAMTGKAISFSPAYVGEQSSHPWHDEGACGFVIVGGPPAMCDLVISAYADFPGDTLRFYRTTARTAELCKYMENCFLATKVAFVNQFFDIAAALHVDFFQLRELWLADPRVGSSHSSVTEERGFRGRCLPKDVSALVAAMRSIGGAPLLEAVLEYNRELCRAADERPDHLG
jgi:UDPglucose 6-dehydrogenase